MIAYLFWHCAYRRPEVQRRPLDFIPHIVPRDGLCCEESWSEWQDLNLRPPRPERGSGPAEFASAQYGVERGYIAQLILARKGLIFSTIRYGAAPGQTAPFDHLNR